MITRYPLVAIAYACAALSLAVVLYLLSEADMATSLHTRGEVTGIVSGAQGANTNVSMGYRGNVEYMTVTTKRVAYTYRVDGEGYRGVGFSRSVDALTKGMWVDVRYSPHDPGESRLEVGVVWHLVLMWLAFSLLFYVVGKWWLRYQRI